MSTSANPIVWEQQVLRLLDQRLLPQREEYLTCRTLEDTFGAIREMVVRGAPCIGFTAVYGLALWAQGQSSFSRTAFAKACSYLREARPTAVNLMFEIDRVAAAVTERFADEAPASAVAAYLIADGNRQLELSEEKNTAMARTALTELTALYGTGPLNLMTHCNTGFLACGTLGTALGVISYAHRQQRLGMVYADETRPYLQGSRLTAFELAKENIPHRIVVEGAASHLLRTEKIHAIFVGADRIAANGDTANKVGTSTLAIVARHYGVPFYVVAPLSSFDFGISSGSEIEIELRSEEEVLSFQGTRVAPAASRALNPSFDVTSHAHITGIISERGLVKSPNLESLRVFR